jgi:hypothetical protein
MVVNGHMTGIIALAWSKKISLISSGVVPKLAVPERQIARYSNKNLFDY